LPKKECERKGRGWVCVGGVKRGVKKGVERRERREIKE